MNIWQRMMYAYWQSQADYLRGRVIELKTEAQHLEQTRMLTEQRLQRAENRLVQYGSAV